MRIQVPEPPPVCKCKVPTRSPTRQPEAAPKPASKPAKPTSKPVSQWPHPSLPRHGELQNVLIAKLRKSVLFLKKLQLFLKDS